MPARWLDMGPNQLLNLDHVITITRAPSTHDVTVTMGLNQTGGPPNTPVTYVLLGALSDGNLYDWVIRHLSNIPPLVATGGTNQ